jgi:hypothetical protein
MKFRSILSAALAAIACSALCACAALTATPSQAQVTAIQSACIGDAVIRPIVTDLEVLATPAEVAAITAARAVIDPVCANPSAPLAADAATTFSESTAQIATIVASLQARKKAAPAAPAPTPAASAASAP